jgi:hypothetical protein
MFEKAMVAALRAVRTRAATLLPSVANPTLLSDSQIACKTVPLLSSVVRRVEGSDGMAINLRGDLSQGQLTGRS